MIQNPDIMLTDQTHAEQCRAKEELLEREVELVRLRYKQERERKNQLIEKERIMLEQLSDVTILHARKYMLKELLGPENTQRVNAFNVRIMCREHRHRDTSKFKETALCARIASIHKHDAFRKISERYILENTKRSICFENNISDNKQDLYNVTIHQPKLETECHVYINGRSDCNDGRCEHIHRPERAKLLCKYEVVTMNNDKHDPLPYDEDSVLSAMLNCPDHDCPLKHCCYKCSYAPKCSCRMVHEHHFKTSKGYMGSVSNQTFHNNRLSNQCMHRFDSAIDIIRDTSAGTNSNFCFICTSQIKQMRILISRNIGRQSNEKLGLMWKLVGPVFDNCINCSNILDSITCGNSPDTCPNNGKSICEFMANFKISPSAPFFPLDNNYKQTFPGFF